MLLRRTAQCTAMTKQGSCALPHIPLACSMNAHHPPPPPLLSSRQPSPPQKTLPGFRYRHHTSRHTPRPYTHFTRRQAPPPPPPDVHSPWPLTTLRNHHPCQVHADPAILSATVRVSWSGAAATVGDVITAESEAYRRWSMENVME